MLFRSGNGLARFPTDGILRIDGRPGDRCGIPCHIKRLLRAHLASPAMADSRNALSPSQEPRKAVERRRRADTRMTESGQEPTGGAGVGCQVCCCLPLRAGGSRDCVRPARLTQCSRADSILPPKRNGHDFSISASQAQWSRLQHWGKMSSATHFVGTADLPR